MILREHEDFQHIILNSLDALPTPFAIINVDTYDIEIANKAFGGDGSTGKKCYSVSHQIESPCRSPCPIGEIRRTGEPVIVYHTHYDKVGKLRYIELHASPVFDKQGRLKYIIEHEIDRSGHKVTEELLRESEEKYRLLAEGTDAVLWEYDILSDKWTYVAPQVEQILGYKSEEWTDYQFWLGHLHPDDQIGVDKYCKECTGRGESHKFEYRFLAKNGSYVWLRDVVNVEMDHDQPVKLRGAIVDISEQKRIKENLQDSEAKLRAVVNSTQDAVIMMNPQGFIIFWNPAAENIFGYSSDEVIGKDLHALLAPQRYHEAYRKASTEFRRTGRGNAIAKTLELEAIRRDNQEIVIELSLSSFSIKDEWYASGIIRDITERKKLEKLKEDVDRITRHDVRSALNGIIAIPQILKDESNLTGDQREYLQMIINSGYTMLNLLNLSITIYQIEQGTYESFGEYFDLLKVCRQCMAENQSLLDGRNSEVAISTEGFDVENPEKINVFGEELLAYSAVSNLVKNAIEASPSNSTVSIDITGKSPIIFSVHNQGSVPKEIRNTFFDNYNTSGKKGGTGIGTYSAKLLAEAQGWSIGMQTSEEKGTKITVTIPKTE